MCSLFCKTCWAGFVTINWKFNFVIQVPHVNVLLLNINNELTKITTTSGISNTDYFTYAYADAVRLKCSAEMLSWLAADSSSGAVQLRPGWRRNCSVSRGSVGVPSRRHPGNRISRRRPVVAGETPWHARQSSRHCSRTTSSRTVSRCRTTIFTIHEVKLQSVVTSCQWRHTIGGMQKWVKWFKMKLMPNIHCYNIVFYYLQHGGCNYCRQTSLSHHV